MIIPEYVEGTEGNFRIIGEEMVFQTDVLVVGGGIAGIRAAIEAHDMGAHVILVNKGPFGRDGASVWMAGDGFQAALYPPDSVEQHIEDTIKGGHFLSNQELVKTFLSLAPPGPGGDCKMGHEAGKGWGEVFTGKIAGRDLWKKHPTRSFWQDARDGI